MINKAKPSELDEALALLNKVNLPSEGVTEHFKDFFIARDDRGLIGCIGLERYGDAALLRSLAVSPDLQRSGLGRALTAHLLNEAQSAGIRDVVLLTTTAEDFFARHFAFKRVERAQFDQVFALSPEWKLPRCSSAACMHLEIGQAAGNL